MHILLYPPGVLLSPKHQPTTRERLSFQSQKEGRDWVPTLHLPLQGSLAFLGPAPPSRTHLPEPKADSIKVKLPSPDRETHPLPGTVSNHRPKTAKFILTSSDAFLLNFRPAVSLQTCSFPAKRRKGWRSILASALVSFGSFLADLGLLHRLSSSLPTALSPPRNIVY